MLLLIVSRPNPADTSEELRCLCPHISEEARLFFSSAGICSVRDAAAVNTRRVAGFDELSPLIQSHVNQLVDAAKVTTKGGSSALLPQYSSLYRSHGVYFVGVKQSAVASLDAQFRNGVSF